VPDGADAKGRYIRSLATVIYELLGGTISPLMLGGAGMAASRYTPLSTLTEEGNEVLKRALDPATPFEGAHEFCNALAQPDGAHAGRAEPPPPVRRRPPTPSVARREPEPPVAPPAPAPPVTPREKTPSVARREKTPSVARMEVVPPAEKSEAAPPPPEPPPVAPGPPVPPLTGRIAPATPRRKKSNAPALVLGGAVAIAALGAGGYFLLHKPAAPTLPADPFRISAVTPEPVRSLPTPNPTPVAIITPAPTARPVAATPKPPSPSEKLTAAINAAEASEQRGDIEAALEGYLKVTADFPDLGGVTARKHMETLLDRVHQQKPPLTRDQFELMRDSIAAAAEQNVLPAMLLLGLNERRENPAEGYNWFLKAADSGSPQAMHEIGMMLASAKGVPGVAERDESKALEYFNKAAAKHYTPAIYALGECYLEGKGVPKDEQKGLKLLRDAAAAKDERAMNKLAAYLARADDPRPISARKEDFKEAFKFASEARDMGYADALNVLAAMYINGNVPGHSADPKEGAKLFLEGAEQGSVFCMLGYAQCLLTGTGVKQSKLDAGNWYERAARAGSKFADEWCRKNVPGYSSPSLNGPSQSLGGPQQPLTQ